MKVLIIGRSELIFNTLLLAIKSKLNVVGIVTAIDAPEYEKSADDFCKFAEENDIPFLLSKGISSNEAKLFFKTIGSVDLGLSANFPEIIPKSIIDLFSIGIFNAHGGDLPRYKGNACQAWAIINGEKRIGLCIHKMVGGELDNGDIIERDYYETSIETKIGDVWEWMNKRTPHMFLSAIKKLSVNPDYVLTTQSQCPKDSLRCYPRKPEDGKIDWSKSAEDILRLINASGAPYAGAFSYIDGEKVIILDATLILDDEQFFAIPGQVTSFDRLGGTVVVACGNGKLSLNKIIKAKDKSILKINSTRKRFCSP